MYHNSHAVLQGLQINPYFTDISGLSWTMEGYQQNKRFYGFLAINCSAISVLMHIIIMYIIVGLQSVFEHSDNSYIAVSRPKYVEQ